MSGYTPGPWFTGKPFHHSGERQSVTPIYARDPDVMEGRWLIAWCHQNAVPAKQIKPNARLIAAAPELLEAGKRVTAAFRAHGQAFGIVDEARTRNECEAAMLALDAAIAKATGVKP